LYENARVIFDQRVYTFAKAPSVLRTSDSSSAPDPQIRAIKNLVEKINFEARIWGRKSNPQGRVIMRFEMSHVSVISCRVWE
jgi:hypothetical protein